MQRAISRPIFCFTLLAFRTTGVTRYTYKRKKGGCMTCTRPLLGSYLSFWLDDLDRLNLDIDLDLVANGNAARLEYLIPGQAEIAAIDLALCAEASALTTPRILRLTLERDVERDRPSHITNGQVAGQLELLAVSLDLRAAEPDFRELLDVQKITRAKVVVTLRGATVDPRCLEDSFHR